jgi:hypothetical protein
MMGCTTGPSGFRIDKTGEVMVLHGFLHDDKNIVWSEAKRICGQETPELINDEHGVSTFICK